MFVTIFGFGMPHKRLRLVCESQYDAVSDPSKDFQLTIAPRKEASSQIQMQVVTDENAASKKETTILASFRVGKGYCSLTRPTPSVLTEPSESN